MTSNRVYFSRKGSIFTSNGFYTKTTIPHGNNYSKKKSKALAGFFISSCFTILAMLCSMQEFLHMVSNFNLP